MRVISSGLVVTTLLLAASGCAKQPPPVPAPPPTPFKIVANAKQLMHAIVIPASDAVWKVASVPPANEEDWLAVENGALALAESGNLLLMEGRAVDHDNWVKQSQALIETSMVAVQAAQAKDLDKVSDAGNAIYDVCAACHKQYMKQE